MFGRKKHKELELLLMSVDNNISNNYKDAAQMSFREFETKASELEAAGKLNSKQLEYYKSVASVYCSRLKNFTHKDQKPYWT